jgi:hypothetical protein
MFFISILLFSILSPSTTVPAPLSRDEPQMLVTNIKSPAFESGFNLQIGPPHSNSNVPPWPTRHVEVPRPQTPLDHFGYKFQLTKLSEQDYDTYYRYCTNDWDKKFNNIPYDVIFQF